MAEVESKVHFRFVGAGRGFREDVTLHPEPPVPAARPDQLVAFGQPFFPPCLPRALAFPRGG